MACLEEFIRQDTSAEVHILIKKATSEAPFTFEPRTRLFVYEESTFTEKELKFFLNDLGPAIIYVAGWANQKYIKVIKGFKKNVPVIMGLDNHWKGTIVQVVGAFYFRMFQRDLFSHIWIPGIPQVTFALMLGFPFPHILTGLYAADVDAFNINKQRGRRHGAFVRKFIFVGRLVDYKGVDLLLAAFSEANREMDDSWRMEIVGNGRYEDQVRKTKGVEYHSFIQPDELSGIMSEGVFVLPSRYEAWGVVLQEAAAAGLPIIATHNTGAATAFVRNGYNGFLCNPGSKEDLKRIIKKVMALTDQELWMMSERSVTLSEQYTPVTWARTIIELMYE